MAELVTELVGFDPTKSRPEKSMGGISTETSMGQHIVMTTLRRALGRLEGAGVIRKVKAGSFVNRSEDDDLALFPYRARTGWVLTSDYTRATEERLAERSDAKLEKLRDEARRIVADRHVDEVEAVLKELMKDS